MYFTNTMFNSQYVNPYYYRHSNLCPAVRFSAKFRKLQAGYASSDLCKAVKKMDEQHQQEAFLACLAVIAKEFGWQQQL